MFILGDLFEMWVGDEVAESGFAARCAEVLAETARSRTVGFMSGNRDFLVGDALLERLGVVRLQDPMRISAFGTQALVSHGDLLCLGDVAYQRFRRVARHRSAQAAFRALPFRWRLAVGRAARARAPARQFENRVALIDVDDDAAGRWMRDARAPTLVHGHTHAPASHELAAGQVRHVLSDWDLDHPTSSRRAEVLRWTAEGFHRMAPHGMPAAVPFQTLPPNP